MAQVVAKERDVNRDWRMSALGVLLLGCSALIVLQLQTKASYAQPLQVAATSEVAKRISPIVPEEPNGSSSAIIAQNAKDSETETIPAELNTPTAPVVPAAKTETNSSGNIAVSGKLLPISSATGTISGLHPKHKYIALTIDDGYNFQPDMLKLLQKYDVRATTFLIGNWASTHKKEVRLMDAAGLEIANHTWWHSFLTQKTDGEIASQLLKSQNLFVSITGKSSPYLRPPYGDTNNRVRLTAAKAGYRLVLWNKTTGDTAKHPTVQHCYDNVMSRFGKVKAGDVILCHWGSAATYGALRRIIPELQAQGFTFVTISELVADSE